MFTGIVQGVGTVTASEQGGEVTELTIRLPEQRGASSDLEVGGSVALDGVCLTATSVNGDSVTFDLVQETLRRTTLGARSVGSRVNVERAMRYGDEVGGHLLSGHVIATAEVASAESSAETAELFIRAPSELAPYIIEKGFIAVDGISLTIGEVDGDGGFSLHIIPETLRQTTLGSKVEGNRVNIEIDSMTQVMVESVQRYMRTSEDSA